MRGLRGNRGFTLVEMAIVLIIIGIILAAVLKGGDLIEGAKEKKFKSELDQLSTAYYTYVDKYSRVPGDDNTAVARWAAPAGTQNGNNDGLINTTATVPASTVDEQSNQVGALDHLRRAGFIQGTANVAANYASTTYPGVSMNFGMGTAAVWGKNTNLILITGISAADALLLDAKYDDGVANTGDIRDNAGGATYPANPTIAYRLR